MPLGGPTAKCAWGLSPGEGKAASESTSDLDSELQRRALLALGQVAAYYSAARAAVTLPASAHEASAQGWSSAHGSTAVTLGCVAAVRVVIPSCMLAVAGCFALASACSGVPRVLR